MTVITTVVCDRCGDTIDGLSGLAVDYGERGQTQVVQVSKTKTDLCAICGADFRKFLNNLGVLPKV